MVFNNNLIERIEGTAPNTVFDYRVIEFLSSLSARLMKIGREYNDVISFAYWCRKSSLKKMAENYREKASFRIGKGCVFHIAPSNVPVNFAYSMVAGLLAGNINVIRIPSRPFPQVKLIVDVIDDMLSDQWNEMEPYIHLLSYGHDKDINDILSAHCDVRVIWGGDDTISVLRQSPLKARATEIPLADRYSIFIIDADDYMLANNKKEIAQKFFNDTFLFDQNACSSPRLVCWLGNQKAEAKELFWEAFDCYARMHYDLQDIQVINKYYQVCKMAIESNNMGQVVLNNYITRIQLPYLTKETELFFYNSGYFFEVDIKELDEIVPVASEKCQTLVYYGDILDKITSFVREKKPKGIDRIKYIGTSGDFSLRWDGYDLILAMSRTVEGFE